MRPVHTEREAETSRLRLDGFGDEQHSPDVPANRRARRPLRDTSARSSARQRSINWLSV